jgi:uncharacterized protein YeaO (DUF488 family)
VARGLAKDAADLDAWCQDITSSAALRAWYGHDPARFDEFQRRYGPNSTSPVRQRRSGICRRSQTSTLLTLLIATRRPEISQAAVR